MGLIKSVIGQGKKVEKYAIKKQNRFVKRNIQARPVSRQTSYFATFAAPSRPQAPRKISKFKAKQFKQMQQNRARSMNRGRPSGSYQYRMPDGQPVDVYTWRKFMAQQKAMAKQQYQMQMAQNPQMTQQGQPIPQGVQVQKVGHTVRAPQPFIKSPDYDQFPRDLRVWEGGNAVGLNNPVQRQEGYFEEIDLMSGKGKIRKQGSLG